MLFLQRGIRLLYVSIFCTLEALSSDPPDMGRINSDFSSGQQIRMADSLRVLWDNPEFTATHTRELLQLAKQTRGPIDGALVLQGSLRYDPFWINNDNTTCILWGILAESIRTTTAFTDNKPFFSEFCQELMPTAQGHGELTPSVAIECIYYGAFFPQPTIVYVSQSPTAHYCV